MMDEFQKIPLNSSFSALESQNQEYKKLILAKKDEFHKKNENYHHIIQIFFNNFQNDTYSMLNKYKDELLIALKQEDVESVEILMQKKIDK